MTFELVKKHSREHDRMASPFEEAALQTVKGGSGDPATRRIYRRLANHVRDNDLWILCVCRGEGSARPVIVPRRVGPDRVNLVNLPHADVPHAEYCVFRLRDAEGSRAIVIPDDFLDPFSFVEGYRNLPGPGGGKERRRDGLSRVPANVSNILKRLIQEARLNTLAGVERFASPGEWLAELRCAAEALYIAPNIPVAELLFTDPGSWSAGEVGRKLDAAERNWPERRRPCGFLCWVAHDVSEYEINSANPSQGHIRVTSPVVFPSVYRRRVSGPYLFLGVVARSDDGGRWECRLAYAQPIVDPKCPIPVDSGYERSALDSLPHLVRDLRDDRGLLEALGGTVRVELQKPLFEFNVAGSRCLPDILVTVTRPGGYGHRPRGPGRRPPDGPYEDRDTVRYVIEVMGFDDPEYEKDKEDTQSRMRRIGRVIRMEGGQFESSYNGVDRQRERITGQIRKDLIWRWKAG